MGYNAKVGRGNGGFSDYRYYFGGDSIGCVVALTAIGVRSVKEANCIAMLLMLCAALMAACNQEDSNVLANTPQHEPLLVPTSTPVAVSGSMPPYAGGEPSLDERILRSVAIAYARPTSLSADVITVPSDGGVAPTYRPVLEFRFDVIEYLKGDGAANVSVQSPVAHTFMSREEALAVAKRNVEWRSATWDNREAVIFLETPLKGSGVSARDEKPGSVYNFESNGHPFRREFALEDGATTAWLPAVQSANTVAFQQAGSAGSVTFLVDPEPIRGVTQPIEFTVEEFRSRIASVEALLKKGEGIEGYEQCIQSKLSYQTVLRGYREAEGKPFSPGIVEDGPFPSGLASRSEFRSRGIAGTGYIKHWLTGTDAELFQLAFTVDGRDIVPEYIKTRNQLTGYRVSFRVARPLPADTYETYIHEQSPDWIACGFTQPPATWKFTFELAEGAVHEAFFDPVAVGAGFGADASNGVLKPASFTLSGGGATTIDGIVWEGGQVKMRVSPQAALAGHHIDFLALDGSVALRLDFDDAVVVSDGGTRLLVWGVCGQPWKAGDLLMLRISESPENLTGVTNDVTCLPVTTTPTDTLIAIPTLTPEPTGTATPDAARQIETPTPAATPVIRLKTELLLGGAETDVGRTMQSLPPPDGSHSIGLVPGGPTFPNPSVNTNAIINEVIARVRIRSVSVFAERIDRDDYPVHTLPDGTRHSSYAGNEFAAGIEYEYEVLEYLKGGDGLSTIWGIALGLDTFEGDTLKEYLENAKRYYSLRESRRWDSREAVVFLDENDFGAPIRQKPPYYTLGAVSYHHGEQYTIDTPLGQKSWLPLASQSSGVSDSTASDGHKSFLWDIGDRGVLGVSSEASATVALLEIKRAIETDLQRFQDITRPANLVANATASSVTLVWDENPCGVSDRYSILRRAQDETEFAQIAEIGRAPCNHERAQEGANSYVDTSGIEPGTAYVYQIQPNLSLYIVPGSFSSRYLPGVATVSITTQGVNRTSTSTATP